MFTTLNVVSPKLQRLHLAKLCGELETHGVLILLSLHFAEKRPRKQRMLQAVLDDNVQHQDARLPITASSNHSTSNHS